MLRASDLVAWLQSAPIQWPTYPAGSPEAVPTVQAGPYVQPMPDRLVVATITGGSGTQGEEQYEDRPIAQIRCRGAQGLSAQSDAEDIAWAIDRFFRMVPLPCVTPAGTLVKVINRTGGQPAPIGAPDTAMRSTFTCSYIFVVGVDFGM